MAKKILITGANGQLGNEMRLNLVGNEDFEAIYTDVQELDITDAEAVNKIVKENEVDYIVNCAAYTAVDRAEDDARLCGVLNSDSVANLAMAARENNAKLVHVSTDYVFDGQNHQPYVETDEPNPKTIYGATKLDGERKLLAIAPNSVIVRTAWLYSPFGKNFVKTMISLGETHDELKVVSDQIGTPTYANDLAKAIIAIVSSKNWTPGIFHFSDEGVCSWYDFTKTIHRIAGITTCNVKPIRSAEYPAKAARPFYSVLDKTKIKQTYGIDIPHWEESLEKCITRLKQDKKQA
jgi:dTDP-4-dehydrorhamnose reductase